MHEAAEQECGGHRAQRQVAEAHESSLESAGLEALRRLDERECM